MKPNAVPRFMLVHVAAKLFSILGGVGVGWGGVGVLVMERRVGKDHCG